MLLNSALARMVRPHHWERRSVALLQSFLAILIWTHGGVAALSGSAEKYFGIQVVDDQTGRGVPLVELTTVNQLQYVTDSAGWVAFHEPGLMGQRVFFHIRSHGYEYPKDGFGFAGVALHVQAREKARIRIKRNNIAERLYRVTGEGIYRDSVLLGEKPPLREPLGSGMVAGQDSVFGEIYRGKIFWFWGDTMKMSYPLGHFWMAGATSELPNRGGLDPAAGINLRYFVDKQGFSRPVARMGIEKGLIWADGFLTLEDETGRERLVCHYAHMESLEKMLGHGLALWNDDREEFELVKSLDMKYIRLFPAQAHPFRLQDNGVDYLNFGDVFPNVRVQAQWQHYFDPESYEAFTCLEMDSTEEKPVLSRAKDGQLLYQWKRNASPMDGVTEQKLVAAGKMNINEAHFLPRDVESGRPIILHRGSVRWNAHRQCWIMIATEIGGTSHLGETWYAEASFPTGPWRSARKIVTHHRYSFYNPVHHQFFDQEGGRWIYFEGTYTHTFSGNSAATPRYDYNQIMYRLDLDDPRLAAAKQGQPEKKE
jgi:hypothetical protein